MRYEVFIDGGAKFDVLSDQSPDDIVRELRDAEDKLRLARVGTLLVRPASVWGVLGWTEEMESANAQALAEAETAYRSTVQGHPQRPPQSHPQAIPAPGVMSPIIGLGR